MDLSTHPPTSENVKSRGNRNIAKLSENTNPLVIKQRLKCSSSSFWNILHASSGNKIKHYFITKRIYAEPAIYQTKNIAREIQQQDQKKQIQNRCKIQNTVLFTSDLKLDFHLLKNYFICFNDSSLQMMKNAFCFILKGLFDLKILKLLSWLFAHVGKTAWLEI